MDSIWNEQEAMAVKQMLSYLFIGHQASTRNQLEKFIQQTQVDEVMVVSNIYNHEARLRSCELVAGVKDLEVV